MSGRDGYDPAARSVDSTGNVTRNGAAHLPGLLPTDAAARKAAPVYSGVLKYFPRALAAVGALSRVGNEQHNPGKPMFWDRSKSGDELDALTRHLLEAGTVDTDGVPHSVKVAWRALANLEKELEAEAKQAAETMPFAEPGLYSVAPDGGVTFQPLPKL